MASLIDAETFLEALENADADVCETYPDFYCDWGFSRKAIEDLLLNIPTIEAKPVVHGEWVGSADGYADGELVYDMWECSECGYDADGADEKPNWNFCPNCGADMRERIENG